MFNLMKKFRKTNIDLSTLKKNDISIVILDKRWHDLFQNIEKSSELTRCENTLKELLKKQGSLNNELTEIIASKKEYMNRIIELTTAAFDYNNDKAKDDMQSYQNGIIRINERIKIIEKELDEIPARIKKINLKLLELTANEVYQNIRRESYRINELDALIEKTREELKGYISEKEQLTDNLESVYSYFHDLLGHEELEKLDQIYLPNAI